MRYPGNREVLRGLPERLQDFVYRFALHLWFNKGIYTDSIKALRQESKMSRKELSKLTGCTQKDIRKVEAGARSQWEEEQLRRWIILKNFREELVFDEPSE